MIRLPVEPVLAALKWAIGLRNERQCGFGRKRGDAMQLGIVGLPNVGKSTL